MRCPQQHDKIKVIIRGLTIGICGDLARIDIPGMGGDDRHGFLMHRPGRFAHEKQDRIFKLLGITRVKPAGHSGFADHLRGKRRSEIHQEQQSNGTPYNALDHGQCSPG